jgi:hypothetical protein
MKKSIIYFAKDNLGLGLIYIGETGRKLNERKTEHEQSALNGDPAPFHKALIDYGFKNWDWGDIEECSDEDKFMREKYWIKTHLKEGMKVLNVTHAGEKIEKKNRANKKYGSIMGGKNVWKSKKAKKWMQISGKLKPVRNITRNIDYQSLTEASMKEIDSRPGITRSAEEGIPTIKGNLYAFLDLDGNQILTDGHKKNKSRTKKVKNRITDTVYNSSKEAAEKNNVTASSINDVCNGKTFTSNGFSFCFIDDNDNEILYDKHHEHDNRKKEKENLQYAAYLIEDSNFENPYIFDTTKEMAESLNIPQSKIPIVCKGERSQTKGWRIAYFDKISQKPNLTETHDNPVKKLIRKIKCLDDQKEFDNATKAAKYYKLIRSQIQSVCEGILKTTGGKRFAYLDKNGNEILTNKHNESSRWKGTQIYCPQLGKKFNSVKHFCDETEIPQKRVRKHLNDNSVYLGGLTVHKL